jgi:NarL family two-component system sensor histidine kinase YdfH
MMSSALLPSPQEKSAALPAFFVLVVVSLLSCTLLVAFSPALRIRFAPDRFHRADPCRVLHWMFTMLRIGPRALSLSGRQGLLSFVHHVIGEPSAWPGLYMMLIGEALGALGLNWRGFRPWLLLALSAINFLMHSGPAIGAWVFLSCPTTVFVIIFVWLFDRQNKAREEAQNALRDLDAAHRQLAEYAAQVEDLTLLNERQRMARELHDTLAQGLAGLILQLEAIDSHLSRGNTAKAQTITQQAMDRARSTLADARRAIDDLRSGEMPEVNLETALREETDRFTAASGIPCELSIVLPPSRRRGA